MRQGEVSAGDPLRGSAVTAALGSIGSPRTNTASCGRNVRCCTRFASATWSLTSTFSRSTTRKTSASCARSTTRPVRRRNRHGDGRERARRSHCNSLRHDTNMLISLRFAAQRRLQTLGCQRRSCLYSDNQGATDVYGRAQRHAGKVDAGDPRGHRSAPQGRPLAAFEAETHGPSLENVDFRSQVPRVPRSPFSQRKRCFLAGPSEPRATWHVAFGPL